MKVYNKEGALVFADKVQWPILEKAGWTRTFEAGKAPEEQVVKAPEEKAVEVPTPKVALKRRKPIKKSDSE